MPLVNWGGVSAPYSSASLADGSQADSDIAVLTDGRYVIVWEDEGGTPDVILAQIFTADGQKTGGPITVHNSTLEQENPTVAALSNGGFAVVFNEKFSGLNHRINQVVFDSAGTEVDQRTLSQSKGFGAMPDIAPVGDDFWAATGNNFDNIDVARHSISGTTVGMLPGFTANADTTGEQYDPHIAQLNNGNVVIVWNELGGNVEFRIFASNGAAITLTDRLVADNAFGGEPEVTALDNGNFIVTYSKSGTNFPADGSDARAQIYTPDGLKFGAEIFLNDPTAGHQMLAHVAPVAGGGFVGFWTDGFDSVLKAQLFDAGGARQGDVLTIDDANVNASFDSIDADTLEDGRIAVTWTDKVSDFDGSRGVLTRIIDPRDIVTPGTADADTIYGTRFDDVMTGGAGDDFLHGWHGDDIIDGGAGSNTLVGGNGRDVFLRTVALAGDIDELDGFSGADTADFSPLGIAVWVDLAYDKPSGYEAWTRDGTTVTSGSWRAISNMSNVDNVVGTAFADEIRGDGFRNDLTGGGGNDLLFGRAGDDRFFHTGGFDQMDGGADHDLADFSKFQSAVWVDLDYTGSTGFEAWTRDGPTVTSGAWRALANFVSIEGVIGSDFADQLRGDDFANTLGGGGGTDLLIGYAGNDIFLHEGGLDDADGGAGTDTADFSGYDTAVWVDLSYSGSTTFEAWTRGGTTVTTGTWQAIANLTNVENINGSQLDDVLYGDAGNNMLNGRGGDDKIFIEAGFDTVYGGKGFDTADFSQFQHAVWVDLDYTGSTGIEAWTRSGTTVTSGAWLGIAELSDVENLTGSAFDDLFRGDIEINVLTGLAGSDRFVFENNFGDDTITDFQDTGSGFEDVIDFSLNTTVNDFGDVVVSTASGNTLLTTADGTITLLGVTSGIDAGDFIF